jgi:hypothetical protein
MTLPELLGVYQQFSPEANARQELLQAEVDAAPLRMRQLEQQLRSSELGNDRMSQLTPMEVEAADAANRLAARLADPQVKAAELETVYRGLQNRLAGLEAGFGEATMGERVKRVGLDNTIARDQNTLSQNRFNADRTDAAFERQMANETLRRQDVAGEQDLNLRLAQSLMGVGDQEGVTTGRELLQQNFRQIPIGLPSEVRDELTSLARMDQYLTPDSLGHYGPRLAKLVEENPQAKRDLPRKARVLLDLYQEGLRTGNQLSTPQRDLLK